MKGYIFNGKSLQVIDVPIYKVGKIHKNKYVAPSKEELIDHYVNNFNWLIENAREMCNFEKIPRLERTLNNILEAIG